jgi:serine acetyltransferase
VLSPGAQLLGSATLGEGVLLGANATVYQGRKVGAGSVLAANSFLLTNLAPGASAVGVPAKRFSRSSVADDPDGGERNNSTGPGAIPNDQG